MTLQKPIKVNWSDIEAVRAADAGVADGLEMAAREILAASNQIVPFDEGVLAGSGGVDFQAAGAEMAHVFYDTPYAVKLHEDRALKINGGRRVQYLRKAVMSSKPHVLIWFGDALKLRFNRGPKVPSA